MTKIEKKNEVSLLEGTGKVASPESISKSQTQGLEPAEGEKVEKIRDILFGTQMRDYEKRVALIDERVRREVTNLKDETRIRLDSVENYIKKEVDSLIDRLNAEHDQREESLKELLYKIESLNKVFEKKTDQLYDQLNKSSRDLRQQILNQSKNLSDEILHKYEEMLTSVEQTAQELRTDKVNRSNLSELLVEIAMRLSDVTSMKLGIDSKDE